MVNPFMLLLNWWLDLLFGKREEFDYTSKTTPEGSK